MDELVAALGSCPVAELFSRVREKHGAYPSLAYGAEELVRLWIDDDLVENPIDVIRDRMITELKRNWDVWEYRLACDGNCYNHPDARVIWCYIDSGTADLYEGEK